MEVQMRPRPASEQRDRVPVCRYWRVGRCNRHPCPFLHGEVPLPAAQDPRRPTSKRRSLVWINPNPSGEEDETGESVVSTSADRPCSFGYRCRSLVWINPKTGGNGVNPNPNPSGEENGTKRNPCPNPSGEREQQETKRNANPNPSADRPCKYFLSGSCSYGDRCRYLHAWSTGDDFSLMTPLGGHDKAITAIQLPSGSDNLYSSSADGTLKVWDCSTGKCTTSGNMGGEIGCIVVDGPWLFVGIRDSVKVYNTQTNTEMCLSGPTGMVHALLAGDGKLIAGTEDGSILLWRLNAATNCFEPAASLLGHRHAVVSLIIAGATLYSSSLDSTIKVWDLATLECVHTLSDHTDAVMSLLCWDQFLLSCSLDNTIKVWARNDMGRLEVVYTRTEEHGALTLRGMHDATGQSVLSCSLKDNSVRLYDLPTFKERGRIFARQEVRAIETGPNGLFFTGDGTGELKVWTWSTA